MNALSRSAAAIFVLAALLRIPGLFTDFWLDEVWALRTVALIDSALDVFTAIHQDINHWLLSLWMYAAGVEHDFWVYRVPSLAAGLAAVAAAGRLARLDRSNPAAAMLLTAVSAPLVIYASEARGYSIAASAAVIALLCLVEWAASRRGAWLVGYWIAASLGLLAHLSFLFALAASTGFLGVLLLSNTLTPMRAAAVQSVPAVVLVLLYVVDLRMFQLSGGQPRTFAELFVQAGSLALGGPPKGAWAWPFGLACGVLLAVELTRRYRRWMRSPDRSPVELATWAFYATAFVFPIAAIAIMQPPYFYPRFLLVSGVFVPVLAASYAASLPRRWGAAVAAVFVVVNAASLGHFATTGRGAYDEALALMQRTSQRGVVTIASDYPLNRMMVEFYGFRLTGTVSRFQYVEREAEFWIASSPAAACEPCVLIGTFPASMVSGTDWYVYQRR
jgi:hypothetical protein